MSAWYSGVFLKISKKVLDYLMGLEDELGDVMGLEDEDGSDFIRTHQSQRLSAAAPWRCFKGKQISGGHPRPAH